MKVKSKLVTGVITGCAAVGAFAAPASAAPMTVGTDAGTTCTVEAGKSLGGGLLVRPISFTGTVDCTLADADNAPTASSSLLLTSSAPLSLTSAGGNPTSPEDQETVPGQKAGEFGFVCAVEPDADCGFAGSTLGIPTASYQVLFGSSLVAPEGETWTQVPEGCDLVDTDSGDSGVGCLSTTEKFTTG